MPGTEGVSDVNRGGGEREDRGHKPEGRAQHDPAALHDRADVDSAEISRRVAEAFKRVPEIGAGKSWYDYPYRLLDWLSTGWRRKLFPRWAREQLNYGLNYLIPFNEHDRHKVWDPSDPLHDFVVPAEEHVTIPRLWVVELFPPSELASLESAIERHAWDRRRRLLSGRDTNQELLARSRGGSGPVWWRLAEIAAPESTFWFPDGTREKLPTPFDAVSLKAIQLGQGLTAVAAQFWLTDEASRTVDEVWHAPHEPQLVRRPGTRPQAEDRAFAAYHRTQTERVRLHDAARNWLGRQCPGFFAATDGLNPLLDMLIMDKFDPLGGDEIPRERYEAFRALGLTEHGYLERTSVAVPKLALVPTRTDIAPAMKTHRTWAIWGQRDSAAAATHMDGFGSDPVDALASRYSDGLQGLLLTMAVSGFLEVTEQRYARLRDRARVRHGEFSASALQELRQHLLTLSLDLANVRLDLEQYRRHGARYWEAAEFTIDVSPNDRARIEAAGHTPMQPVNLNEAMRQQQVDDFDRLTQTDADYREILSTAASLGASVNASRLSRRALWVAAASLVVALVTVLVADFGDQSVLSRLLDWLRS
jgi:hypothetical protein